MVSPLLPNPSAPQGKPSQKGVASSSEDTIAPVLASKPSIAPAPPPDSKNLPQKVPKRVVVRKVVSFEVPQLPMDFLNKWNYKVKVPTAEIPLNDGAIDHPSESLQEKSIGWNPVQQSRQHAPEQQMTSNKAEPDFGFKTSQVIENPPLSSGSRGLGPFTHKPSPPDSSSVPAKPADVEEDRTYMTYFSSW